MKSFYVTAPLRFDTCSGHTDIPIFAKAVGTEIANLAIDLYSDKERTNKLNLEIHFHNSSNANGIQLNIDGKEENLDFNREDPFFLPKGIINYFIKNEGLKGDWTINIVNKIPKRTGLGGSGVLSVCLVAGLYKIIKGDNYKKDPDLVIKKAREIEVKELEITGGFQDFIAPFYGGLSLMNFTSLEDTNLADKHNLLGQNIDEEFETYLNNNLIVIVNKEGNANSSDIVEDEINTYRLNQEKTEKVLKELKKNNKDVYELIQSEKPIEEKIDKFNYLMDKDWIELRKLSSLMGQGLIKEIENEIKPIVDNVRGQGAAANSLSIIIKPEKQEELYRLFEEKKYPVSISYAKVNKTGLEIIEE